MFRNFERDFFQSSPLSMMPSLASPFAALAAPAPLRRGASLLNIPLPSMSLDVKQTDKSYVLKVEIPGVDRENLNIEIDDDQHAITVSTETQKGDTTEEGEETSDEENEDRWLMRERAWGSASRTIYFPDDADLSKAEDAQLENGVLILNVPKKEGGAAPKRKLSIK